MDTFFIIRRIFYLYLRRPIYGTCVRSTWLSQIRKCESSTNPILENTFSDLESTHVFLHARLWKNKRRTIFNIYDCTPSRRIDPILVLLNNKVGSNCMK